MFRISYPLMRDLGIVGLSIFAAVLLVYTNAGEHIFAATSSSRIIGSFIAGFFYTSVFTTAPATVALASLAHMNPLSEIALVGGAGALAGDFLIFRFVRDSLSTHLLALVKGEGTRRLRRIFALPLLRWLIPIAGILIIGSPLPDELGLFLLGFTHTKTALFALISFLANSFGILVIGLVTRAII